MRRGISPVVAAVLLVIIAVAAGVLVWVWLHGFATKNPTEQPALQERIKIEAVQYDSATTTVTAYVRNIGAVDVTITSAYVFDARGNVVCSDTTLSTSISSGSVGTVSLTCSLTSGKVYVVKVVTERGTEATYQFTAP